MNRARLIALGFVATLLLPTGASAANEGPDRTGPYASLSFALSYDQFQLEGLDDFGTGMGIDVRGGYRLHRWLATELEFDFVAWFRPANPLGRREYRGSFGHCVGPCV